MRVATDIPRDTATDLMDLRETIESRGFGLIEARIRRTLEQARLELETDLDEQRTARVRGSCAMLRAVLAIPRNMEGELLARAQKK